jgi:hypothetical protein
MFKQAERKPSDGEVSLRRSDADGFLLEVVTDGVRHGIFMSEYNASRVFASLALMLKIPLSKAVGKEIKL